MQTLATEALSTTNAGKANSSDSEPYGLDPDQLKYITAGFKIGQSGVFGASAAP
jgi:hypothetical protein